MKWTHKYCHHRAGGKVQSGIFNLWLYGYTALLPWSSGLCHQALATSMQQFQLFGATRHFSSDYIRFYLVQWFTNQDTKGLKNYTRFPKSRGKIHHLATLEGKSCPLPFLQSHIAKHKGFLVEYTGAQQVTAPLMSLTCLLQAIVYKAYHTYS